MHGSLDEGVLHRVVAEINRALRARGWSAQQASVQSGGGPELIRNLRRGREPRLESLEALCDVLGLEFYVGPRREVDEARLDAALEAVDRALGERTHETGARERARAAVALYGLTDWNREPVSARRVTRLLEALNTATLRGAER